MVAAAVAGAAIVGGVMSSDSQKSAANTAANAQTQATQAGIAAQQQQFDKVQQLLSPYVTAGNSALTAQGNLVGLNGPDAQQQAIQALQQTPAFTSQLKLGENRILANASATGGLRGGNTQQALGMFAPQLLAQVIQQQYGNLGGLVNIGQNAAAGVGNSGNNSTNNITSLMQGAGGAQAQAALAGGRADMSMYGSMADAFGKYLGSGGTAFSGWGGGAAPVPDAVQGNSINALDKGVNYAGI